MHHACRGQGPRRRFAAIGGTSCSHGILAHSRISILRYKPDVLVWRCNISGIFVPLRLIQKVVGSRFRSNRIGSVLELAIGQVLLLAVRVDSWVDDLAMPAELGATTTLYPVSRIRHLNSPVLPAAFLQCMSLHLMCL